MPRSRPPEQSPPPSPPPRRERLAAALKANIAHRKAQAAARTPASRQPACRKPAPNPDPSRQNKD
jgi:hypothetical protein